jgi:hypothetical protein
MLQQGKMPLQQPTGRRRYKLLEALSGQAAVKSQSKGVKFCKAYIPADRQFLDTCGADTPVSGAFDLDFVCATYHRKRKSTSKAAADKSVRLPQFFTQSYAAVEVQ